MILNLQKKIFNFVTLLFKCLLQKNPKNIKYILINLHDYTNTEEILYDFPECLHISLGQDLKTMFSRNKFKKILITKV